MDTSSTAQVAEIMAQHCRTGGFIRKNLCGPPFEGLLWERHFEKKSFLENWRKHQPESPCLCIVSKVYSCLCTWKTSKWLGEKHDLELIWKRLMKHTSIWRSPRRFLMKCTWDALDAKANRTKISSETDTGNFSMSRVSAGATGKRSVTEKSGAIAFAWSYDMEGHAKKTRGAALRICKQ